VLVQHGTSGGMRRNEDIESHLREDEIILEMTMTAIVNIMI
jgi:hypothetical protein